MHHNALCIKHLTSFTERHGSGWLHKLSVKSLKSPTPRQDNPGDITTISSEFFFCFCFCFVFLGKLPLNITGYTVQHFSQAEYKHRLAMGKLKVMLKRFSKLETVYGVIRSLFSLCMQHMIDYFSCPLFTFRAFCLCGIFYSCSFCF